MVFGKVRLPSRYLKFCSVITKPENTHHGGSITVQLTSCLPGLDLTKTSKTVVHSTLAKQLNSNKINRRSAIQ